ncbi:MAG: 23S rRNA (adenine(2030)-N(6))-methyltransferase RlmJ [Alphaproteobacteria bacterium]|nr:23S rRNA (adenine(2030)-N(6))-methyltransferase RlmJ [Alphaproteobacteria bacterium]
MLSYQHIYHAGNMADIHKHLWLITVLDYLNKKDKPYCWLDTHSGRGLYDLSSKEANKTEEYKSGIDRFYSSLIADNDLPHQLQLYRQIIENLQGNSEHKINTYPGSAYISAKIIRNADRFYGFDLHKQEFSHLKEALASFKNAKIEQKSGYDGLKALFPPQQRRGGVLIDPSYEIKDEYEQCAKAIIKAYKKWPQGVYMIWYPIMTQGYHSNLLEPLKALNLEAEDLLTDEWHFDGLYHNMIGSGMAIINPPYSSEKTMKSVRKHVSNLLK